MKNLIVILAGALLAGVCYGQNVSVVAETGEFVSVPTQARVDAFAGGTATVTLAPAKIWVGNTASNQTAMAVQGDVTITQDGTNVTTAIAAGVIVDADINASAAIAGSKLASAVQTSLGKADTAIQTELDPVWTAVSNTVMSGAALGATSVQTEADPVASPVINALIDYLSDGLLVAGDLAISGESALKFKTTATAIWTVGGVAKAKVGQDEIVFSAADTINVGAETNTFYGAWLVEVNASGVVATKPAGGLVDQVYEASATAIAALPAATAGSVALGYILVTLEATAGESFTANTDALTTIAAFVDGDVKTLPAKIE